MPEQGRCGTCKWWLRDDRKATRFGTCRYRKTDPRGLEYGSGLPDDSIEDSLQMSDTEAEARWFITSSCCSGGWLYTGIDFGCKLWEAKETPPAQHNAEGA